MRLTVFYKSMYSALRYSLVKEIWPKLKLPNCETEKNT